MNETTDLPGSTTTGARRDLLWAGLALLFFLAISAGFLVGYNPRLRKAILGPRTFDLTIVHTNDTWGYLDPCG